MNVRNSRVSILGRVLVCAGILAAVGIGAQEAGSWKAGESLVSASADHDSTSTLTLVAGAEPGTYTIPSVNAEFTIKLTPQTAEASVPLMVSAGSGGAVTLTPSRIKGVTVETRFFDGETFVAEVKSTGREGALVSAEVRRLDGDTTAPMTVDTARPMLLVEGTRDAKVLQVFSHNAFRMRHGDASVLVAPVEPSGSLFISLGSKMRTWKEITGHDEPSRTKSPFENRPGK